MNSSAIVHGPNLRQVAVITVVGYLLGFGVPFVSLYVLEEIFVVYSAAETTHHILATRVFFVILGLLVIKSGYIPTWLGVVLVIDGAVWIIMEAGPLSSPPGQYGVPHRHVIRGTAPPGLAYRLGHKAERTESGCHGPTWIVRHGMTENDHLLGRVPMEE